MADDTAPKTDHRFTADLKRVTSKLRRLRRGPRSIKAHRGALRRLTRDRLDAFEQRHGVRLPADFAAFVTTVDHGGLGPGWGLVGSDEWPDVFDGHGPPPAELLGMPSPLTTELWLDDDAWAAWRDRLGDDAQERWLGGTIRIATHGCAFDIHLVVAGPLRGRVVSIDRDQSGAPRFPADPSFLAWYERWLDELLEGRRMEWFGLTDGGSEAAILERLGSATAPAQRAAAARELLRLPRRSTAVSEGLRAALRDEAAEARAAAAEACAGLRVRVSGDEAQRLLGDTAAAVRAAAAPLAARTAPDHLRAALRDGGDPQTYWSLVSAAADADRLQLRDLEPGLAAEDARVRRQAVFFLGRSAGREATRRLVVMLDDHDAGVRLEAVQALGVRVDRQVTPVLRALADGEPDDLVRRNLQLIARRRRNPLHALHLLVLGTFRWLGRRNARGI